MEINAGFWIKFSILFVPLTMLIWFMAPTLKWKILFTPCVAVGILLALAGRSMKGVTPLSRRGY